MWRDPLGELIEELERVVPSKAPKRGFDPADFQRRRRSSMRSRM